MSHPHGDPTEPYPASSTTSSPSGNQETAPVWPPAAPAQPATQPFQAPPSFAPADTGPVTASTPGAPVPGHNPNQVPGHNPGQVPGQAQAPAYVPGQAPGQAPAQVPAPGAAQAVYTPGSAVVPTGHAADGTAAYPASAVPVSGYPVSGYPMPGYPATAPKPKRTGMIVLTIATAFLSLTTIAFGVLWILESGQRSQADAKVAEQTTALTAADAKIKEVESKLSTKTAEAAQLNQDLTGAKNKTDEVTKARDALAACMQASDAYAASRNANTAKDLIAKCTEAEKYY